MGKRAAVQGRPFGLVRGYAANTHKKFTTSISIDLKGCAVAAYAPLIVPTYVLFLIPSIAISGVYCPQAIDNVYV